jgi:4-amino-4-deoxy-L-arabinose transferase-like glycosyltransferase
LSSDLYDEIAWSLVSGHGYRVDADTGLTMLRSPGFVMVLVGMFYLFGQSLLAVQIMNFVFSIFTAAFAFLIARELVRNRTVAWVAAGICFFFPGALIADLRGGLESTQTLLIAATTFLALKARKSGAYSSYVLLGLVFGFNVLVKASVAFMLPAVFLYELIKEKTFRARGALLARYCVAGLMAVLVSVPWVVRNYQASGEFVPTMTVTGKSLYFGVYTAEHYTFDKSPLALLRESAERENEIARQRGVPFKEGFYPLFYDPVQEYRYYGHLGELALTKLKEDPLLLGRALALNSVAFWILGREPATTMMNTAIAVPVLALVCYGILVARRRKIDYLVLLLPIIAYVVPFLFILAQARYYIPIMPLMAVFMALALVDIAQRLGFRSTSKTQVS